MYSARENTLMKARQDLEVVKNQVKRMSYLQEQTEENNMATGYSRQTCRMAAKWLLYDIWNLFCLAHFTPHYLCCIYYETILKTTKLISTILS